MVTARALLPRPARSVSTSISTAPGGAGATNVPVTESGSWWVPPACSTVRTAASAAIASR